MNPKAREHRYQLIRYASVERQRAEAMAALNSAKSSDIAEAIRKSLAIIEARREAIFAAIEANGASAEERQIAYESLPDREKLAVS